jgi:23S rRNA (guanosine2251-2'-O)-methyltransferase
MALEGSSRCREKRRNIFNGLIQKELKKSNQYLIGMHSIAEAIHTGKEINKVFIKKGLQGQQFSELFKIIRQKNIPFQYVPSEKLNRINPGNQGIIAVLSLIEYKNLDEIVQRTFEKGDDPFIIVLDQITDVRNFGAISRTAECAGAHAIVIPSKGSVSITSDAIKSSAGALNRIAICRVSDLVRTVQMLRERGLIAIAATEKTEKPYYSVDLTGPVALILGSEENGIHHNLLKIVDSMVRIPLLGSIESLNVSVAFGIIAFEIIRQRRDDR